MTGTGRGSGRDAEPRELSYRSRASTRTASIRASGAISSRDLVPHVELHQLVARQVRRVADQVELLEDLAGQTFLLHTVPAHRHHSRPLSSARKCTLAASSAQREQLSHIEARVRARLEQVVNDVHDRVDRTGANPRWVALVVARPGIPILLGGTWIALIVVATVTAPSGGQGATCRHGLIADRPPAATRVYGT